MIRQIQISNFGSIHEDLIIECGQLTLIRGGNGSGKSMILQAIALALMPYGPLPRSWSWDKNNRGHVRLNIINPVLGDLVVDRYFRISKNSNRFIESVKVINGQERHDIGFLQNLVQVFVFEAFGLENSLKGSRNFLRYCSRLLGFRGHVHSEALKHIAAIFEQVNRRPERSFREVILQEGND
jgi:energy-coupling factor transporter ATP-binding protein EcfA2